MSKKKQIEKNLELSNKLALYLMDNPQELKNVPSGAEYIVFSASDKKLNEENQTILDSLVKKGEKVVKAIQTKSKSRPWDLNVLSV